MRTIITCIALVTWSQAAAPAHCAEMRTWTAAAGGFTVEAELVELKAGDVVRLKTKDGREIDVPLGQLSAADQAFVRPSAIAPSTVMPEKPSASFVRAMKAADRCRNPDEAIVVLKVFVDDPQHAPAERAYAAGRIAECQDAAAKNQVRVNKKWVAKEEADAVRKKADELMRQGLLLYKLNEDAFKRKFTEAAALEPEEVRAEFLMGVVYTLSRAGGKALPVFQKCLVRDPENVAVLNNVAMLAAAKRDYNTALSAWRRALDQPDQHVVHNVGRFLEQCTDTKMNIPKNIRDALAVPYAELTASGKFEATSAEVGWLLMLIDTSDLEIDLEDKKSELKRESPAPKPNDDGPVIGSGTGFVIAPGYVLTNAHVAVNDAAFEIQTPDGKLHRVVRVASDEQLDLALLKCEAITAPPLALEPAIVPRGTDVMLFGYPEMLVLGTSLKATRGSISSLPDPALHSKYLYDAVSNAGNSGGPLCNDKAGVVAVHSTGYNTAGRYAGGIPSTAALEFVKKSLPDFQPIAPATVRLEWPQVDEKASASTMLIWIRKKNAEAKNSSLSGDVVELPFCLFCGGQGELKCDNPACKGGFVPTRQGRLACETCNGAIVYDCHVCGGIGVDVALPSVQRALEAAAAAKAAAGTTTSSASDSNLSSATTPTRPVATARPVTPIRDPVPPKASGRAVELLSTVNPNQQYSPGSWIRRADMIVGGGPDFARLAVPYQPPAEYDLLVNFQLLRAGDEPQFHVGLISANGRQFNMAVAATKISMGIGAGAWIATSHSNMDFTRRLSQLRLMVRKDRVVALLNDVQLFHDKSGNINNVGSPRGFAMAGEDARRLFFGSQGVGSQWAVTALILVPVVE